MNTLEDCRYRKAEYLRLSQNFPYVELTSENIKLIKLALKRSAVIENENYYKIRNDLDGNNSR